MKLRTIVTSKILAVAVVSAAGCNQSVASPPPPAPVNAGAPNQAKPPTPPTPATPGKQEPPALVALRDELLPKTREEAFAALAHFRPLCDAEGFPLVGNVVRKTPHNYTPSAFCGDVRKSNGK